MLSWELNPAWASTTSQRSILYTSQATFRESYPCFHSCFHHFRSSQRQKLDCNSWPWVFRVILPIYKYRWTLGKKTITTIEFSTKNYGQVLTLSQTLFNSWKKWSDLRKAFSMQQQPELHRSRILIISWNLTILWFSFLDLTQTHCSWKCIFILWRAFWFAIKVHE